MDFFYFIIKTINTLYISKKLVTLKEKMKKDKDSSAKHHLACSGGKASQHGSSTGGGSTYFKEKAAHALIHGNPSKVAKKKSGPRSKQINVDKEHVAEVKLESKLRHLRDNERTAGMSEGIKTMSSSRPPVRTNKN